MKTAALIFGIIGICLNLSIYQQKTQKGVLLFKLSSNVAWAMQYLLLGAYTGFGIACVGIARETTFISVNRKGRTGAICLSIFALVAITCSILTWESPLSILPAIASVLSVFGFYFSIPRLSRILACPISLCMGIYDITVGSYIGIVNEAITISSAIFGIICIDILKKSGGKEKIRVSAINWDCSLPSDTYFGFHQTRTLSPFKYRKITPFYADIIGEDKIEYHKRSQKEFDRELRYAIRSGIDYFSYVFYPEEGSKAHVKSSESDCSANVYELNYARRMHESSSLRDKIGMTAIMGAHPFLECDYLELARLTMQPYYERIDGRPIVYLFQRIKEEDVLGVRSAVEHLGGVQPLFIPMFFSVPADARIDLVDGISAYACTRGGVSSHEQLLDYAIEENEKRAESFGLIVPTFPTGWNPAPRIDIPSPWVSYEACKYASWATHEELIAGGERFAEWLKTSEAVKDKFSGHIVMFAWNEFEEGGWICPTYNEDLSINTERIKTVSKMIKHWKRTLG